MYHGIFAKYIVSRMKNLLISCLLFIGLQAYAQSTPIYLDETKPIEQRIDDALSRMTLSEKIAIIHAQSKFSSPGVARLGIPDLGPTMVLTAYAPTPYGTNGAMPDRPTTRA